MLFVIAVLAWYGYMAPEYSWKSCLSTKADVFSFGVLVLEIITGQSILDFTSVANEKDAMLIDYARRNWREGTLPNIIDPRIDIDSLLMTKFVKIGLLCVQENATFKANNGGGC
ncbi:putative protein kinase RLK-Pelle-DLSV family [Helianthus annuus]|nr:putative protein kinase RLK-Pelle-DLSV family [Helianthus annuus]